MPLEIPHLAQLASFFRYVIQYASPICVQVLIELHLLVFSLTNQSIYLKRIH